LLLTSSLPFDLDSSNITKFTVNLTYFIRLSGQNPSTENIWATRTSAQMPGDQPMPPVALHFLVINYNSCEFDANVQWLICLQGIPENIQLDSQRAETEGFIRAFKKSFRYNLVLLLPQLSYLSINFTKSYL